MLMVIYLGLLVCLVTINGQDRDYFWFLTDFHYDPSYFDTQWSCREDIVNPGEYGDYLCDAPWALIASAAQAAKQHGDNPEFLVWSGDISPHFKDKSDNSRELLMDITLNITRLLNATFPGIPILPVIGNHDYFPKNELPSNYSDIYDAYADLWEPWFGNKEVTERFRQGGFYSMRLKPKVVGLVPNTNLYHRSNPLYANEDDPGNQYIWMKEQLDSARQNGDKVYLFIHIPPGYGELEGNWRSFYAHQNERFLDVIEAYSDIIEITLAGHNHLDTFKLLYKNENPMSTIFVAPSITPWQSTMGEDQLGPRHNPGLRKIWMKADNYEVDDIDQYYVDLPEANKDGKSEWKLLYSFKELYKVNDITPVSIQGILNELKKEDNTMFYAYYSMNTVHLTDPDPCDCDCKYRHLCSMEYLHVQDYEACINDPPYTCSGKLIQASLWMILCIIFFGHKFMA